MVYIVLFVLNVTAEQSSTTSGSSASEVHEYSPSGPLSIPYVTVLNAFPLGKYQFPRPLPALGVPQQVASSVTQYTASSSSPMTAGSRVRRLWLESTVPL